MQGSDGERNDAIQSGVVNQDQTEDGPGCCGIVLFALSYVLLVILFPFSLCCSLKVLQEYERGIILRLGRVVSNRPKGPGLVLTLPCIDELRIVDIRTFFYDIQPQKVLTKDSLSIVVDAVVYAKISNVRTGALSGNIPLLTGRWTATALCKILAAKTLSEILSERKTIAQTLKSIRESLPQFENRIMARVYHTTLYKYAQRRGVTIERVEVKAIRMPPDMQRAMAVEAETSREAKAKVIAAKGEMQASQMLQKAADVLSQSPASLKLRYLQSLSSISSEKNSVIVFPLPPNLIDMIFRRPQTKNIRAKHK